MLAWICKAFRFCPFCPGHMVKEKTTLLFLSGICMMPFFLKDRGTKGTKGQKSFELRNTGLSGRLVSGTPVVRKGRKGGFHEGEMR